MFFLGVTTMLRSAVSASRSCAPALLATLLALAAPAAHALQPTVLYSFDLPPDGGWPEATLVSDSAGNLYGTTTWGGPISSSGNACQRSYGCGTVFKLTPGPLNTYTKTILHEFSADPDGTAPKAEALAIDAAGNLYGTTAAGGGPCTPTQCGTVFKLSRNATGAYTESVIWKFGSGTDGGAPMGGVIADSSGNLYGTTMLGGNTTACAPNGCGTVFKLTPSGTGSYTESAIWKFNGGSDGSVPQSGLVADGAGNLYGTTTRGGNTGCVAGPPGCGTVFKLSPNGAGGYTESVLHVFSANTTDGYDPTAKLAIDSAGNLYGTVRSAGAHYRGAVFKLSPSTNGAYVETILYSFGGGNTDGAYPFGGVVIGDAGALYGTTQRGGDSTCQDGCGTIYKLLPNAAGSYDETVLARFAGWQDGSNPLSTLMLDALGDLYGTARDDGIHGKGTVFKLSERPEAPELALVSALLPYYQILFGVTADGGGAVITASGKVIKVPPRPGDKVMAAVAQSVRAMEQAIAAREAARVATGSKARKLRGQSVKELQDAAQAMKDAESKLAREVEAEQ